MAADHIPHILDIRRFVVRFISLAAGLSILSAVWGQLLGEALLPVFKAELELLDDTFRIDAIYLDHQGAHSVIRLVVGLARCLILDDRAHCGDPRGVANATTMLGNVLLPTALFAAAALAWPTAARREWPMRLVAVCIGLPVLWLLDAPMMLWAALWRIVLDMFSPDTWSPLLAWAHFLQSGGRYAIPFALGACCVLASRALCASFDGPNGLFKPGDRSPPCHGPSVE